MGVACARTRRKIMRLSRLGEMRVHGIITTLQSQIGSQPSGQQLAKTVQSNQNHKSGLAHTFG